MRVAYIGYNIIQGNLKSSQVFIRATEFNSDVRKVQKAKLLIPDEQILLNDPIPQRREIREIYEKIYTRIPKVAEAEKEKANRLLEQIGMYLDYEDIDDEDIEDLIDKIKLFYETASSSLVNIHGNIQVLDGIKKDAKTISVAFSEVEKGIASTDDLDTLLIQENYIMCKIIAIANQKGGVAKTTTTINLGVGLSKVGKRVMLIDADPQGHLTMGLGFPKNLRVTLKTMMENIIMGLEFDPREAILHHEEGIDVIPSNKLLSGMDMSLFTVEDREKVLKEYLELLENDYDYILIDCMPSLGMMTINALSAADSVLIPVQPQYYAADGLMELLKVVKGIHQRFNPDLQIEGILFTMDSSHYNNSKRNKQAVRDAYGAEIIIFDQTIPRTEALAETASEGVSIFSYDAKGKGAYSYQALVQEVLNHA